MSLTLSILLRTFTCTGLGREVAHRDFTVGPGREDREDREGREGESTFSQHSAVVSLRPTALFLLTLSNGLSLTVMYRQDTDSDAGLEPADSVFCEARGFSPCEHAPKKTKCHDKLKTMQLC